MFAWIKKIMCTRWVHVIVTWKCPIVSWLQTVWEISRSRVQPQKSKEVLRSHLLSGSWATFQGSFLLRRIWYYPKFNVCQSSIFSLHGKWGYIYARRPVEMTVRSFDKNSYLSCRVKTEDQLSCFLKHSAERLSLCRPPWIVSHFYRIGFH